MSNSRLTKKVRKIRIKSARRRLELKNQSFRPVVKSVDVEKIKKEFEAGLTAKTGHKDSKETDKNI